MVATSMAVEGLPVTNGEHLLVADNASRFAACVSRLATDDALCESLAARGRSAVERQHSRRVSQAALIAAIERVLTPALTAEDAQVVIG